MKVEAAKFARDQFEALKDEYAVVISAVGLRALVCKVRQKDTKEEDTWSFQEIGIECGGIFWGKMFEQREDRMVQIRVVMDLETIRNIEFEIYEADAPDQPEAEDEAEDDYPA